MASGRRDTLNSIQDNSLKKNSTELTMSELQVELAEVLRKRNELVSSGEVSGEDKNPGSLVKRKSESALRGARKNSGEDLDEFLGHHDPRLDSKNVFIPGLDYRVLNPEGKYLKSFGYIILLSLLYIIFAVPFRLAFLDRFSSQESMYLLVIDRFIDCFFVLDIFLNFFTAFKKEDGELEVNRRKIAVKYLKTFFILDLLAVLPFEYMQQDNNVGVVGPAFRFPRIIRIIRLVKVFRSHAYKDLIQHFVLDNAIDASIARIFWIFCILVIFVHFGACFWYFWGTLYENNNQNAWTQRTWLQDSTSDSVNYHYLLSVYWCLTTLVSLSYSILY